MATERRCFVVCLTKTIVTFLFNSTLGKPTGSVSSILGLLIFYNCGLFGPNSAEHAIARRLKLNSPTKQSNGKHASASYSLG
ncbi:unnamed protein product [Schistosoma rodhaini]|uniref:Uncharacterized protein n=1 Tax=Schistosoma rodhaini TaxID=6188 RepID=A0AA85FFY6_9TREM|nr:unnamed protein product [Schistosoma rodhaini]